MNTYTVTSISDMNLVTESLSGNRDAFGQIVSRYQTLICSLAYSATGNLSQSEDLAQETFFTAWKQLSNLREPEKLRSWLCGIARNLINNTLRRQGREPVHHAETLEMVAEAPAVERAPGEHAISNEEAAILWRSLERIPDIYREALVLYYREHQSIETVAENLDLTEDAVKQRLSRGRKLLQEEVTAFVEGALRQSAPGQAFAGAVLAALPIKSATLATAGAGAAKGGGFLSMLTLPLLGLFGFLFGSVWVIAKTKDQPGGKSLKQGFAAIWLSVIWVVLMQNVAGYLQRQWSWTPQTYALVQAGNWWIFTGLMLTWQVMFFNHHRMMRLQKMSAVQADSRSALSGAEPKANMFTGFAGLMAWCGFVIGAFAEMMNLSMQSGDTAGTAVVSVVGLLAIAWPYAQRTIMGNLPSMKSRWSFMPTVLIYGLILFMVNWRLDLWIAGGSVLDLARAHQLMPMWIIHTGTLALLAWLAALIWLLGPKGGREIRA